MGTETLRWWRQLLEQLQQAASEASAAAGVGTAATPSWQPSNLEDIHDTINCLGGLPDKLPKAVWKKLVGFKVPAAFRGHTESCVFACYAVVHTRNTCVACTQGTG